MPPYEKGDILKIRNSDDFGISHYVVYIGKNEVVHFVPGGSTLGFISGSSGLSGSSSFCSGSRGCAEIRRENFDKVVGDKIVNRANDYDNGINTRAKSPDDIVDRATRSIGPTWYNVLFRNCEHFANWCRYAWKHSKQASKSFGVLPTVFGPFGVVTFVGNKITEELRKNNSDYIF